MSPKSKTILRFVIKSGKNPMELHDRFYPNGQTALNRYEWKGKEPRSCAVTGIKGQTYTAADKGPILWNVEVSYRPKGTITYVGNSKYDGWTALMLDRQKDGTLLNGHGEPLPDGAPPVYLPFEVYQDVDFNEIDFGEFIEEVEEGVKHITFQEVQKGWNEATSMNMGAYTPFMAPRRSRPTVKIVLSNAPSGVRTDGFGTRIVLVNNQTPHLRQVLTDELIELASGFVEGRFSIKSMSTPDSTFVDLSDALVDCTPNQEGKDSRFGCIREYVPENFLDELAERLMAVYDVDVSVVDGQTAAFLISRAKRKQG